MKLNQGKSIILVAVFCLLLICPVSGNSQTHISGDVTGDGMVDLQDAIVALQILVEISPSTPVSLPGDVNGDDRIGLEEAIYAIRKVAVICLVAPSGLVGWWTGDGNALDIIGPNDGTLMNGATFAPGMVDQGFIFDGVDDEVAVSGTNINDLQQLTIDAWVKHDSLPSGRIMRYVSLDGEKAVLRYDGINGPRQLHFYMTIDGMLRDIRVHDILQVGVFHHVAGTYDGSVMRLYLDGVEIDSLTVSGTVGAGTAVTLGSAAEPLHGLLDEVEIYNRALSASEIQAIFNAGELGKCKPGDLPVEIEFGIVFSRYDHYEASFGLPDSYKMIAVARAHSVPTQESDRSLHVYIQNVPTSSTDVKLSYHPNFDLIHQYLFAGGFRTEDGYPSPGSDWERSYTTYVDIDGEGDLDPSEPQVDWSISSGSIRQMGLVQNVDITDGYHPTIAWDSVANAEYYRVRLHQMGDGWIGKLVFESQDFPAGLDRYQFEYTGDFFQQYGTLAILIDAWETNDGGYMLNRSRYIAQHSAPLPSEQWDYTLDGGQGSGNLTLNKQQDGSITVDGSFTYSYAGAPLTGSFTDGTATITGTSASFTAMGTATYLSAPPGYQTSAFTLNVSVTTNNGEASGTYAFTFSNPFWPSGFSGNVVATRTNGGGITQ
jgi:hypothetical protein